MLYKRLPRLRLIKLIMLSLTVALACLTLQNQMKMVSFLHKDIKRNTDTREDTMTLRDVTYNIKVAKEIDVNTGKSIRKTNRGPKKEICSHKRCYYGDETRDNRCRKFLSTTRDNIYLIKNENMCIVENGAKQILVFVHSAPNNFERRTAIRQTWGNISRIATYHIKMVFLLGRRNNETEQTMIHHENALYGDIVQGNFFDTYHNLSQKHVLGIRWASEFCKTAKYVIKVDDDVFLNPFGFFRDLVTKYPNITRTILCNIRLNGTDPIQRSGTRKLKWGVDDTIYKTMKYWPFTFCQGYVVIYSSDIVPEVYNATTSKCTPYVWLDDVYVTGILAKNVGNIRHSRLKGIRQHIIYIHNSVKKNMYNNWSRVQRFALRRKTTRH